MFSTFDLFTHMNFKFSMEILSDIRANPVQNPFDKTKSEKLHSLKKTGFNRVNYYYIITK